MDVINKKVMANTTFTVNNTPLKQVYEFKYLGRILEKNDNDWPTVNRNIKWARIAWARVGKFLVKVTANVKEIARVGKFLVKVTANVKEISSVYRAIEQAFL
jgi:hypothetical protein